MQKRRKCDVGVRLKKVGLSTAEWTDQDNMKRSLFFPHTEKVLIQLLVQRVHVPSAQCTRLDFDPRLPVNSGRYVGTTLVAIDTSKCSAHSRLCLLLSVNPT